MIEMRSMCSKRNIVHISIINRNI